MSNHDFRFITVGKERRGMLVDWDEFRVVAGVTSNKETGEHYLRIKSANPMDREAVNKLIEAAGTKLVISQGVQKFMDVLSQFIDAEYHVKNGKNTATFKDAKSAIKFAAANKAVISKVIVG